MKPLVYFKALGAVLVFIFTSQLSLAQSCGQPRSAAIVAYLQYKGAGWEMGWWPEESSLGFFAGMSFSRQQIKTSVKDSSTEIVGTQVYGKVQLRLYERVALTTSAGLVNGQQVFYAAGLRFNFPLNQKTAVIGEPNVGNQGFNLMVGIAKRF